MQYLDSIYGTIEIDEPVILEIINGPSMQRLKHIDQYGYYGPRFPGVKVTRFDHSLGVFCLLRIYGAPLTEQIAGLIHDVSHSAFSHCIDYTVSSEAEKFQGHQDNIFDRFVKKTEIPEILEKYKIDSGYILDDKNFPLKERKAPDLCADRIDYVLRDASAFKEANETDIKYILKNLRVADNKWIFSDFKSAKKFADLYLKMNSDYYAGVPAAVMLKTVGNYLKYALDKKYIDGADLFTTDGAVMAKINKNLESDSALAELFEKLNNQLSYVNNPDDYEMNVFLKSRIVDPLFFDGNKVKRVSENYPDWKQITENNLKPKEYFLKYIKNSGM